MNAGGRDSTATARQYKAAKEEAETEDDGDEMVEDERWARAAVTAEKIGENPLFSFTMIIMTIWALYQTDIRLAGTDLEADTGFEAVISIIFFFFLFEIGLQCLYKNEYFERPKWSPEPDETWLDTWYRRTQIGSFYFWLDWIAALSLIFEVRRTAVGSPFTLFFFSFFLFHVSLSILPFRRFLSLSSPIFTLATY